MDSENEAAPTKTIMVRLAACPNKPNCVSTTSTRPSQSMPPIHVADEIGNPMELVAETIRALPRMTIVEASEDYLHATSRTAVFRFVDDVEFAWDASQRKLHFRSASRLGYSDLGLNRKRMQQLSVLLAERPGFDIAEA